MSKVFGESYAKSVITGPRFLYLGRKEKAELKDLVEILYGTFPFPVSKELPEKFNGMEVVYVDRENFMEVGL